MKESILLLFLIILLTIETDGNTLVLRRKQGSRDRCHRMQEVRLCPGAPKSWHYDVRISECRISNEEECGAVGNQFQSKEDCEKICPGSLNISARQSYINLPRVQPFPQHGHQGQHGPNPCCGQYNPSHIRDPCNRQCCPDCGHPRPIPPPYHDCPEHCCPNCGHPRLPHPIQPIHGCHSQCCGCPEPRHPGPLQPIHGPCRECHGCCYNQIPQPQPYYGHKSLCPSNLHCPTVCSSSRLTPELNSRCCGCRTGTIIRPPCSSHHRCDYYCRNTTDHNCGPTTVAPTAPEPIIGVTCPINEPNAQCKMHCEFGFKKTSAGCPYCECEESFVHRGVKPRQLGRYCNNIRAICRLHCPHGFVKDRHGCDMCQCIQTGLTSSTDCSLKPSCTMFCEHGFQKGSDGCDICLCSHINTDKI